MTNMPDTLTLGAVIIYSRQGQGCTWPALGLCGDERVHALDLLRRDPADAVTRYDYYEYDGSTAKPLADFSRIDWPETPHPTPDMKDMRDSAIEEIDRMAQQQAAVQGPAVRRLLTHAAQAAEEIDPDELERFAAGLWP
jgi:hypothetical protein